MPLSNYSFFCKKKGSPNFVLPQKRTLQTIHEFQNNLEKIATIATLGTNQDPTLFGTLFSSRTCFTCSRWIVAGSPGRQSSLKILHKISTSVWYGPVQKPHHHPLHPMIPLTKPRHPHHIPSPYPHGFRLLTSLTSICTGNQLATHANYLVSSASPFG